MPGKRPRTKATRKPKRASGLYRTGGFKAISAKRPELKFIDIPQTQSQVPAVSPGAFGGSLVNGINQGTGQYNRIGRLISSKYLEIKWCGAMSDADVLAFNPKRPFQVRVFVIIDHQCNGAAPTISEMFANNRYDGVASTNTMSQVNMQNRSRFTVLRDELFTIGCNGAGNTLYGGEALLPEFFSAQPRTWKIDLKGLKTTYKSTGGGSLWTDVSTNSIWFGFFKDDQSSTAGAANPISLNYTARLRYYDV